MEPAQKLRPSAVVNWSIPVQLIDQFPAAVVVINCPPFRGTNDHLPPLPPHWPRPCRYTSGRSSPAVLGYAVAEPDESITGRKRHGLINANSGFSSVGGGNVIS
jgi:hypothetical protein